MPGQALHFSPSLPTTRLAVACLVLLLACHAHLREAAPSCAGPSLQLSTFRADSSYNGPWIARIPATWTVHTRDVPGQIESWSGYLADSQWVDVTLRFGASSATTPPPGTTAVCTLRRLGQTITLSFDETTNHEVTTYGAQVTWPGGWELRARAPTRAARDTAAAIALLVLPDSVMMSLQL